VGPRVCLQAALNPSQRRASQCLYVYPVVTGQQLDSTLVAASARNSRIVERVFCGVLAVRR
jgi:hypothetical protein